MRQEDCQIRPRRCSRFQDCRSNECCLIGASGGHCGKCTNPPCNSVDDCKIGEYCVKGSNGNRCSGICPDPGSVGSGLLDGVFNGAFDGIFDGAFDDVHKRNG